MYIENLQKVAECHCYHVEASQVSLPYLSPFQTLTMHAVDPEKPHAAATR
jgi:hypothetical protein